MYTNGEIIIMLSDCTVIVESCKSTLFFYRHSKDETLQLFLKLIEENS